MEHELYEEGGGLRNLEVKELNWASFRRFAVKGATDMSENLLLLQQAQYPSGLSCIQNFRRRRLVTSFKIDSNPVSEVVVKVRREQAGNCGTTFVDMALEFGTMVKRN
jgi:hypothetical protein